ncbi:DUF503 domain-containing protein [Candidatus Bipolaricaulota bacterium]|nr:DUF503 domain-containing protein [Candidatus Bipolaricaulota bacterium]RLE31844.1 MAG: hypothetical protein DRJ27_00935 [Candidatus Acetothermia bacterium]RLE35293.1 MAG: hypothetical protein DRJ58_00250 [Candidatus Acetothermia bacterium]
MHIRLLEVRLRLYRVANIKERRSVVEGLVARLRRQFNVSVAEIPSQERDLVILALVNVSSDGAYAEGMMEEIVEKLQGSREFYLEDHKLEVF